MMTYLLLHCIFCNARKVWGWGVWVNLSWLALSLRPLQPSHQRQAPCNPIRSIIFEKVFAGNLPHCSERASRNFLLSLSFSLPYVDKKICSPNWGWQAPYDCWEQLVLLRRKRRGAERWKGPASWMILMSCWIKPTFTLNSLVWAQTGPNQYVTHSVQSY